MRKYRLVAKKGEGTFSEVLKAQNVKDGRYHAIKCMKNRFESIDQVNNLREIQALRRLSPHEHVISLEEVLYDQPTGRLALVFELMDANLYELIRGRRHYLNTNLIKSYMWQLMKSLDHMHKKGIFHRDIKPENILIESSTDVSRGLKLADFGSCRGIYSKQPYTEYISTRWYRAPECLLTDGYYGPEMDLWGAGCVMFEITSLYPLFPGSNEVDQINRIHKVLGTPGTDILNRFKSKGASHISFDFQPQKGIGIPQLIPHAPPESVDLIVKLLKYDATERITAREAMRHPYFKDIRESENSNSKSTADQKANTTHIAGSVGASGGHGEDKNLPSIGNSDAAHHHHHPSGQHKMQHPPDPLKHQSSSLKPTGGTIGHGTTSGAASSSLPPINNMGAGGTQFSKFHSHGGDPNGGANKMAVASGAGGTKGLLQSGNNSMKRRKKYKLNYMNPSQQQKQRTQQNSEGVMRAYGVPKLMHSSGNAADGSGKYGGGGGGYAAHPNRHYVQKK